MAVYGFCRDQVVVGMGGPVCLIEGSIMLAMKEFVGVKKRNRAEISRKVKKLFLLTLKINREKEDSNGNTRA
jgi:hypothetical protein